MIYIFLDICMFFFNAFLYAQNRDIFYDPNFRYNIYII